MSYKLSQDRLEILFSCFRAIGGYNNNPNCIQFSSSYKRLLHHNEVKSSAQANCVPIDSTSILTVSLVKKVSTECNNIEANQELDLIDIDLPLKVINSSLNHVVLYIAGFVEKRILEKLTCETCFTLLNECDEAKSDFIKRKSLGFLHFPRTDTYIPAKHVTFW